MPDAEWFALQIRPNFEKRVSDDLIAKGVEVLLPTFQRKRRWHDRMVTLDVPVFPRYLFVRIGDDRPRRAKIRETLGVIRFLGNGKPEAIPEREIESFRILLSSSLPFAPHPFLKQGAWVRLTRGPLQGVEGFLTRIKNETRVVLSIDLLAQAVATEVDTADIEVLRAPLAA